VSLLGPFTMVKPNVSYAIVGAGVFGAATTLHLIRKYPSATVSVIDREPFPCQVGALWNWNKVVRADSLTSSTWKRPRSPRRPGAQTHHLSRFIRRAERSGYLTLALLGTLLTAVSI
jgi:glycine/D-amino acid oxidase-like deaminating enzyme